MTKDAYDTYELSRRPPQNAKASAFDQWGEWRAADPEGWTREWLLARWGERSYQCRPLEDRPPVTEYVLRIHFDCADGLPGPWFAQVLSAEGLEEYGVAHAVQQLESDILKGLRYNDDEV